MRTIKNRIKGFTEKIELILSSASSSRGSNERVRPLFVDELFEHALKESSSSTNSLEETLYKFSEIAKGNKIMPNEMKMAKGQGEMETNEFGGKRESNKGRGRFDLVPYEAIEELAIWYEQGAEKYGDRNWEKGMSVKDCINRMMRHAFKASNGWMDEGPFAHLVAVIWNAIAAIVMIKRYPDRNDFYPERYKKHFIQKESYIEDFGMVKWPEESKMNFIYNHSDNNGVKVKTEYNYTTGEVTCKFNSPDEQEKFIRQINQWFSNPEIE